jgi:citrate synthase
LINIDRVKIVNTSFSQDHEHMEQMIAPAGLKGLVVADTTIGDVRGSEGYYHYRGRSAVDIARHESFESAWSLVLDGAGNPPIVPDRSLDERTWRLLDQFAGADVAPLDGFRALVGRTRDYRPMLDTDPQTRRQDAVRIASVVPTLVAGFHRRAHGLDVVRPSADRSHAADYLRMLTGTEPDARQVAALETYLIATIDHGFNASTFTARVIASTGSDMASAVIGATGAFLGPLHGGAPGRVLDMLDAIGDPADTGAWVRAELARGGKIMGFGHAVYRTEDPRSRLLLEVARTFDDPLVARAEAVEAEILRALRAHKPDQPIQANVEFYAAVVLHLCDIPPSMFTPTFAVARAVGWTAHALEQAAAAKIMRPSARYTGPVLANALA